MKGDIVLNIQSAENASNTSLTEEENLLKRTKSSVREVITTTCMFVVFIAIIILVSAVPIVQIIIGSLYKNSCPINYLIPIYLIVAGAATLTLFINLLIKIVVQKPLFWGFVQIVIALFCLVWFIMGNIWIFKANKTVQYLDRNDPSTYCNSSVFNCAFGTLFISYGFLIGIICHGSKSSK